MKTIFLLQETVVSCLTPSRLSVAMATQFFPVIATTALPLYSIMPDIVVRMVVLCRRRRINWYTEDEVNWSAAGAEALVEDKQNEGLSREDF